MLATMSLCDGSHDEVVHILSYKGFAVACVLRRVQKVKGRGRVVRLRKQAVWLRMLAVCQLCECGRYVSFPNAN